MLLDHFRMIKIKRPMKRNIPNAFKKSAESTPTLQRMLVPDICSSQLQSSGAGNPNVGFIKVDARTNNIRESIA